VEQKEEKLTSNFDGGGCRGENTSYDLEKKKGRLLVVKIQRKG
jgi:hypothetical protein